MKSRLLAALLSISLLLGSMPVTAAEPGNSVSLTETESKEGQKASETEADNKKGQDSSETDADNEKGQGSSESDADNKKGQDSLETEADNKKGQDSSETDADNEKDQDSSESDADNKKGQDSSESDADNEKGQDSSESDADNEKDQDSSESDVDNEKDKEPSETETETDNEKGQESSEPETSTDNEENQDSSDADTDSEESLNMGIESGMDVEPALEEQTTASEDDVPALECDANDITVVKSTGDKNAVWYSFTAPEAGYYSFRIKSGSYSYVNMDLCETFEGASVCKKNSFNYITYYIEKDKKVFLNIYLSSSSSSSSQEAVLDIRKLTIGNPVESGDEPSGKPSYYDMGDCTLAVSHEVGAYSVRLNASVEAKDGKTLADKYTIYVYLVNKEDNSIEKGVKKIALSKSENYQSEFSMQAYSVGKYELQALAEDTDGNITSLYIINSEIEVESLAEPIIVHNIETYADSIILDVETRDSLYCYYAPTDFSVEEKYERASEYWSKLTFSDLKPGTEYYFQFTNNSKKPLHEIKASTEPAETKVVYSAQLSEDNQNVELKAEIEGCNENAERAWLHYEYINALGEKVSEYSSIDLQEIADGDIPVKNFAIQTKQPLSFNSYDGVTFGAFEAGTQYDITMWVELDNSSHTYEKVIPPEVKTIQTPAAAFDAEKLECSVEFDEDSQTVAGYTVKIDGLDTDVAGQLYYKPVGSKAYYKMAEKGENITLSQSSPSKTVSFSYTELNSGIEYEFVIIVGGVRKSITEAFGSSRVKLNRIGEGEVNPFDFVRSYQLEGLNGHELSGSYSLDLSYLTNMSDGTPHYAQMLMNAVEFNEENNYQAEIKTAVLETYHNIRPDTDYDLRWELRDSSNKLVNYYYESIHTAKPNITFTELESNYSIQKYQVTLSPDDIRNFESFPRLILYAYAKKEGNNFYRSYGESVELNESNGYSSDIKISVLEASTSYELSLRARKSNGGGKDEWECAAISFTTPEDARQIDITGVISGYHSVTLRYTMLGFTPSIIGAVFCYIREKGAGGKWEEGSSGLFGPSPASRIVEFSSYGGKELKEGTEYEYRICVGAGLGSSFYYQDVMAEGSFQTKADERVLSGAGASAAYATADISAVLSGNNLFDKTYIHLFYRENNASVWVKADSQNTEQDTYNYNTRLTALTPGTEYEYMLVISDSADCDEPDEVVKDGQKAGGNFTTKACQYSLNFTTDESRITADAAVISVSAEGSDEDERLQVILTLDNGQEQTVILRRSGRYSADVTFSDLTQESEYTIKRAVIVVTENDSEIVISDTSPDYKFKTKSPNVPEKITLSEENLYLNAIYDSNVGLYDGYNSADLNPVILPETAEKSLVYKSSDEAAATVSESGQVIARGAGSAEITVASKYNQDIKAVCKITVKKYAVGYQADGENVKLFTDFDDSYSVYKNSCVDSLGLYERDDDGNVTLLSDFAVTSERTAIADWKDGKLYAYTPGVTALVFEKDGIKARIIIRVAAAGRGFGITGFSTKSQYPAIKEEDGSYTLAYAKGVSYTTMIEISPKEIYNPLDFEWILSEDAQKIAQVSETGIITPKKEGDIQLTVKPIISDNVDVKPYTNDKVTVTLHIKPLPNSSSEYVYALANVSETVGEVAFPDKWGEGWSWKYPETPLVTNGVYADNSYPFEAVYSGTDSYPCERTLLVCIGRITGADISETTAENVPEHKKIVEVGNEDSITFNIEPLYQGQIESVDDYIAEIPDVRGLTITRTGDRTFIINAQKKGSYTLKPILKWKKDSSAKVLASAKYKLKAVDKKQVGGITLTTDTEGIEIEDNTIILNEEVLSEAEDRKGFTFHLNAEVKDRYGNGIETALVWKTTDKKVAVATAASKKDTHSGNITIKGSGHTVISVTAKDAAGAGTALNLEVQDHRPRINTGKAGINLAYDYDSLEGKTYAAAAGGAMEIIPVYGETLDAVRLYGQDGQAPIAGMTIVRYEDNAYLVKPSSEELNTGVYDCSIYVKTSAGNEYNYPLKVTVTDKAPTVKAKMDAAPNLFFKNTEGYINISIAGEGSVDDVTWEDASSDVNNGFSISCHEHNYKKRLSVLLVSQQSNLKLADGKLSEPDVAKGTLTVRLKGYKKRYTFENFTIKYGYKKPMLVTKQAGSNIVPNVGQNGASFAVYDKTNKRTLFYGNLGESCDYYDEITCENSDITLAKEENSQYITYSYNGTANKAKITLTLDSPSWREPLAAVHNVKAIAPKAVLSSKTFTFNTNFRSTAYSDISLKNAENITYTDIVTVGANAKSQKLLDDDLFVIISEENRIKIEQSQADLMGSSIAAGTYSYKVTPYCTNILTNEKMALNTMTFKIKVVNKAVEAKVSPKGSLNLTYGAGNAPVDKVNTAVLVDPKFKNMGSGYRIRSCKLAGEYSGYFTLHNIETICYSKKDSSHYYISINNNNNGISKLKAGQKYRLAIEYTIANEDGETFKVTSNTFTIKPKQTAPKIKVLNNNQILCAAAADMERSYSLSIPAYYSMKSASGSIDCNKDGRADIVVSGRKGSSYLTVKIVDKDAVNATVKGKSYSIPVTVNLYGCDGIAKDVKVKINVKVIK